jgi:hypothetical protein
MDQFDAGHDRLCPSKRFESQHRAYAAFDVAVILFNQIIQSLTVMVSSSGLSALSVVSAAVLAPLLSIVTIAGAPWCRMALRKKRNAAAASRLAVSRKSMVLPSVSTARYRYFH